MMGLQISDHGEGDLEQVLKLRGPPEAWSRELSGMPG